ncbi:glycogen phosphorylase [Escherichia coli]|uniref:Glycogen phosphorylase n=1 Tax=Escherichia coli TaxID=562 RepID=A0A376VC39_ECOLX|nr:Glycogen phosphorylase [Escherichia coli]STJ08857.1 glycogen phosphorylase [Escherichia coli]
MNAPFTYSSPTLSVEALKHSIALQADVYDWKGPGRRQ